MKHAGLIVSIMVIFLFGVLIGKIGEEPQQVVIEKSVQKLGTLDTGNWSRHPKVDMLVNENPKEGYDIQLIVDNLIFAPPRAGRANVQGEGNAFLYIDGKQTAILLGPWYHIGTLYKGNHEIRVTLNSNSYEELVWNGRTIADSEIILVE